MCVVLPSDHGEALFTAEVGCPWYLCDGLFSGIDQVSVDLVSCREWPHPCGEGLKYEQIL